MRIGVDSTHHRLVIAIGVALAAALAPASPAFAYHDVRTPPVDNTAYTLRQGEFQLGLLFQHAGVFPRVQINTVAAGYALGAFSDVFLPNASIKVQLFDVGDVSFGADVGFAYARFRPSSGTSGTRADLFVLPASAFVSWRPARWFIGSFDATFAWVHSLAGSEDLGTSDELEGVATISTLTFGTNLTFPLTRVFAVYLGGRVLAHQGPATVKSNTRVDTFTTVTVDGNVTIENANLAWQLVPGVFFSWGTFNLRAGVGYGSFFVPRLGMFIPTKTVVPELELAFRF